MDKLLKHILFRIVLIVISLHATIQHPHFYELSEEKHHEIHENTNSFIGIIRIVFHESHDENLDNLAFAFYENAKSVNPKYKNSSISVAINIQYAIDIVEGVVIQRPTVNKLIFVKLNGDRGPPLFV